ncbi:UMP kinase [Candidatus Woesearchaeota archaeon]|nr:UMP kinase [Candidatus Woesearchaeota archaeon]
MKETVVISLGGSLIVPDGIDTDFLASFRQMIYRMTQYRFVIICGGGKVCRRYQDAARSISTVDDSELDWIGIRSTQLNAELVRCVLGDIAFEHVVTDPHEEFKTDKQVIVGSGFRPGSSSDLRAVQFAVRFGASMAVNMSNITHVYDKDPRQHPDAEPLTELNWESFKRLVGDLWTPGLSMPFDPIASKEASSKGLDVVVIGSDLENLEHLLMGQEFVGTRITS